MLHAIIMAGGAGTRFWPESRADRPKQLLGMVGDRTMIQATADRLGDLVAPDRVWVATTERLASQIAEQLPELRRDSIIVEPCKRDTAPCVGLAAVRVLREDPQATMALMPSDQVIAPEETFQDAIQFASELVEENPNRLVTFGIRPGYAAETFGYIERGERLEVAAAGSRDHAPGVYRVRRFHEKPDAKTAQEYLEADGFYWNSGIFLWKAQTILDALARHEPGLHAHLERIAEAVGSPDFQEVLAREFEAIRGVSIDYAVMERAEEVVVVEAPFDWDDVGNWRALERLHRPDESGSVVVARRHLGIDTAGAIVQCDDPNHVVVTVGVRDLIVVVTPDATLVAHKEKEELLRQVTKELAARDWKEHL